MSSAAFTILGVAGSLRRQSYNRALLRAAAELVPPHVVIETFDIGRLPHFNQDVEAEGDPPEVRELKERLRAADALLIATPEYNWSTPGVLKNAIDWASRPLLDSPIRNKPAAVLSSSTGMFGGVWAAAETRKVLGALGARTLEDTVSVPKADGRLAEGVDATLRDELRTVVGALAAAVEARAAAAA